MLHAAFLRSQFAHARIMRIESRRRCSGPAWSRSTPPTTSATTGSPARCWCRRRRLRASSSTSAPRCRWPRTRCATSASRWRWWLPKAATWPRTRSTTSMVELEPLPRWSISKRRCCRGCGAGPRRRRLATSPRTSVQRKGDYAAAAGAGRSRHQAPLSLRPRHVGADRDPRRGRAVGCARQQLTVWDTTQAPGVHPQRPGRHARPVRAAGAGDRAVRRRRLRAEDHDVLSRRRCCCPGRRCGSTARSNGSRTGRRTSSPRRRSAARCTTPRWRSTRDGRILGVKDVFLHDTGAYDPYGLTVPINSQCTLLGPYDIPNYDSEFTAVFTNKPIVTPYRGAGRQHGVFVIERLLDIAARELGIDPRRDPAAQPDPAGRVSLQQRDHLSGFRAARLRQRQLRAGARQGAGR